MAIFTCNQAGIIVHFFSVEIMLFLFVDASYAELSAADFESYCLSGVYAVFLPVLLLQF